MFLEKIKIKLKKFMIESKNWTVECFFSDKNTEKNDAQ